MRPAHICLYGAGGHGLCVALQIERRWNCEIVFADASGQSELLAGKFELRFGSIAEIDSKYQLLVTIGQASVRKSVQLAAQAQGLTLTSFVADPENMFGDAIGAGTVVLAGAIVNAGAELGAGVIVNSGAVVEHGCHIGAFSHIAPRAVVLGDACIGADCWIGANATVLQGRRLCDNIIVGAGAVVTQDLTVAGTYVGQPARLVSSRSALQHSQRTV